MKRVILFILRCGRILLRSVIFYLFVTTFNVTTFNVTTFNVTTLQHDLLTMEFELLIYLRASRKKRNALLTISRRTINTNAHTIPVVEGVITGLAC